MEADISEDLSGDLKNFIVSLMSAGRDESDEVNAELVQEDAEVELSSNPKSHICFWFRKSN